MDMTCAEVRELLPAHVRRGDSSLAARRHLARCEGCRAELARYERLLAGLAALQDVAAEPPPGLLTSLIEIPAGAARLDTVRGHVTEHRNAYVGGAAAAIVAAGALLWRQRARRLATA
jgi:hypothetical protein